MNMSIRRLWSAFVGLLVSIGLIASAISAPSSARAEELGTQEFSYGQPVDDADEDAVPVESYASPVDIMNQTFNVGGVEIPGSFVAITAALGVIGLILGIAAAATDGFKSTGSADDNEETDDTSNSSSSSNPPGSSAEDIETNPLARVGTVEEAKVLVPIVNGKYRTDTTREIPTNQVKKMRLQEGSILSIPPSEDLGPVLLGVSQLVDNGDGTFSVTTVEANLADLVQDTNGRKVITGEFEFTDTTGFEEHSSKKSKDLYSEEVSLDLSDVKKELGLDKAETSAKVSISADLVLDVSASAAVKSSLKAVTPNFMFRKLRQDDETDSIIKEIGFDLKTRFEASVKLSKVEKLSKEKTFDLASIDVPDAKFWVADIPVWIDMDAYIRMLTSFSAESGMSIAMNPAVEVVTGVNYKPGREEPLETRFEKKLEGVSPEFDVHTNVEATAGPELALNAKFYNILGVDAGVGLLLKAKGSTSLEAVSCGVDLLLRPNVNFIVGPNDKKPWKSKHLDVDDVVLKSSGNLCKLPVPDENKPENECTNADLDLFETQFGLYLIDEILPIKGEKNSYWHFRVKDNQFDPCAELSWVVLSGKDGSGETVVFFHKENMISFQEPVVESSVAVSREVGGKLRVGATTYTLDDGTLSVVNGPRGKVLTTAVALPAGEIYKQYYGNVRKNKWDRELPLGAVSKIPIGNHTLECRRAEDVWGIVCRNGQFPHLNTLLGDTDPIDNSIMNRVTIEYALPFHFHTDLSSDDQIIGGYELEPGHIYKQGRVLFDYRGDRVTIIGQGYSVQLGEGYAHEVDSPLELDVSKLKEYENVLVNRAN